jgi:hypothetical protein
MRKSVFKAAQPPNQTTTAATTTATAATTRAIDPNAVSGIAVRPKRVRKPK